MKKVLLGLLALSATLMAKPLTPIQSTGVTNPNGGNRIDINTKAFIVDSGLIITDDTGTTAIKSIELDHGTLMKGTSTDSSMTRTVFVKKANGSFFPRNAVLEIAINSQDNMLKNLNSNSTIPHRLTATIDEAASGHNSKQSLVLEGDSNTNDKNEFTVGEKQNLVGIELNSYILKDNLNSDNLSEGAYSNTSTLSVKFSKIPTVPGTPANSQPAVPLSR